MSVPSIKIDNLLRARIRAVKRTTKRLRDEQIIEACDDASAVTVASLRNCAEQLLLAVEDIESIQGGR